MIALRRTLQADADPARAFEAAEDLSIWLEGLEHTHLSKDGARWKWHVALLGAPLHGDALREEHAPPARIAVAWTGAMRARWTLDVSPGVPRGSRIAVSFECEPPGALLGRAAEPGFVETLLARWLDDSLASLRAELEDGD